MGHANNFFVANFGIDRLQYNGDFPPYDRENQVELLKPHVKRHWQSGQVITDWNYPAGYVAGANPFIQFGLSVSALNNLTAKYDFRLDLLGESAQGYPFEVFKQSLSGGFNNTLICPSLPNYVYSHNFRLRIWMYFWAPDDEAYVPYQSWQYNPAPTEADVDVTNRWYATFSDPNFTFPRYKGGGVGSFQTIPWYQIIEDALDHVTRSGADKTVMVTQPEIGLQKLTTDLYVRPNRPNGPGTPLYNPDAEAQYYRYSSVDNAIVFDLRLMWQIPMGDCQDFAAFLESEARSLGISNVGKRRLGTPYGGMFWYYPLKFCGSGSFRGPGSNDYFIFHHLVSRSGGIYDFAVGFVNQNPPPNWRLALGSSTTTEESDLIFNFVSGNYPTWSSVFSLGQHEPVELGDKDTWVK